MTSSARLRRLEQLLHDEVVLVVVAQVIRGHGAEVVDDPPRQLDVRGDLVAVRAQQRRQHVLTVDAHRPDPCEVIQPGMTELHGFGCDAEPLREEPLKADCDVAEPDRAMAVVEERAGHDAHGFVKSMIHASSAAMPAHAFGDVEDDRHRAQRLGESTRSGRLLADASAAERDGLVRVARRLPTDADLQEHGRRAVDRRIEIARQRQPAVKAVRLRDALRCAADHLEPSRVGVLEHELIDAEADRRRGRIPAPARGCTCCPHRRPLPSCALVVRRCPRRGVAREPA